MKNKRTFLECCVALVGLVLLWGCGTPAINGNSEPTNSWPVVSDGPDSQNESKFKCAAQFGPGNIIAVDRDGKLVLFGRGELRSMPPVTFADCVGSDRTKTIWVAGDGRMWSSNDNGTTWSSSQLPENSINISQIRVMNSDRGWILTSFHVLETGDGGKTWEPVVKFRQNIKGQPVDFSVGKGDSIAVCDNLGWVYFRRGGQNEWKETKKASAQSPFCRVFVTELDSFTYWSSQSGLTSTTDGGSTWTAISLPEPMFDLLSLFWFNESEGLVAGYLKPNRNATPKEGRSALYHTVDGGITWDRIQIADGSPFFTLISIGSDRTGFIVSRESIFLTSNGVDNWEEAK